jgi:hypothetical protein
MVSARSRSICAIKEAAAGVLVEVVYDKKRHTQCPLQVKPCDLFYICILSSGAEAAAACVRGLALVGRMILWKDPATATLIGWIRYFIGSTSRASQDNGNTTVRKRVTDGKETR